MLLLYTESQKNTGGKSVLKVQLTFKFKYSIYCGSDGTKWSLNIEELWVWLHLLKLQIFKKLSVELTSCPSS